MRLFFSPSGTSPLTMRCARPSTIAVLPTPGSPISTGLFLVRRCSTWMVRRISSSRPITGSSLPDAARAVRSIVYFSSAWRLSSAFGIRDLLAAAHLVDRLLDRAAHRAGLLEQPRQRAVLEGGEHEQLAGDELVAALLRELVGDVEQPVQVVGDVDLARRCPRPSAGRRACSAARARSLLTSDAGLHQQRADGAALLSSSASMTCAGSMNWWSRPTASDWASASACWNRLVSLSCAWQ